jgi:hypothetical protein
MAVGDLITAARYNGIQTEVALVLGPNPAGYGQSLSSAQKAVGAKVTLTDILNLRSDMVKARQHQTGVDEGPGGTGNFPVVTSANLITDAYAANLEEQALLIVQDARVCDASERSLVGLGDDATDQRTTNWTASLIYEVEFDFGNVNEAKYFFNAGGEFHIESTITGDSGTTIANDWNSMLEVAAKVVVFAYGSTTNTGTSGTPSDIGYDDLTAAYQVIYTKTGSGTYTANDYTIRAKINTTGSKVTFKVEYNDDKVGNPNFDEAIDGTLTCLIRANHPTSTNVTVALPSTVTKLSTIA